MLPSDSYETWALVPAAAGSGFEPREGVYLLEWAVFGCDDVHFVGSADCMIDPTIGGWFVRGRLDAGPILGRVSP